MMQNDVVVVGGGISGLSLAFYCVQAGMKTTILEKNDTIGGSFASPHYSANGKKFLWLIILTPATPEKLPIKFTKVWAEIFLKFRP